MGNLFVGDGVPANTTRCKRCGQDIPIPVPLSVTAFGKWVSYQEEVHKTCEPAQKSGDSATGTR